MKMRRLISAIIALLLVVNLSVTAFAAEWYLEDGDITVSAGENGFVVFLMLRRERRADGHPGRRSRCGGQRSRH